MAAWAGLGYYSRARNLLKCARLIAAEHGGAFPDEEEALLSLPGIGSYTAAAIAAIAFNREAAPVDGNIERVLARLYGLETPLPALKPLIKEKNQSLVPANRPGDFAQAMMDLGATLCTPKRPNCLICPWHKPCQARDSGMAESLPKKPRKNRSPSAAARFIGWKTPRAKCCCTVAPIRACWAACCASHQAAGMQPMTAHCPQHCPNNGRRWMARWCMCSRIFA